MASPLAVQPQRIGRRSGRQACHKLADDVLQGGLRPLISLILNLWQELSRKTLKDAVDSCCVSSEFDRWRGRAIDKPTSCIDNKSFAMPRRASLVHHSRPGRSFRSGATWFSDGIDTDLWPKHGDQIHRAEFFRRGGARKVRERKSVWHGTKFRRHRSQCDALIRPTRRSSPRTTGENDE
jgi:hypothetical protein